MSNEHTPGPWHVAEDRSHGTRRVYGPDGHLVADAGRIPRRSDEEMDANADLIAAAPDMFNALLTIVHLSLDDHEWSPQRAADLADYMREKARQVLDEIVNKTL